MRQYNQHMMSEGLPVRDPAALLMAAVIMQAKMDCVTMSRNREYYMRNNSRMPDDEILMSIPAMERWISDPGVIEFWSAWQTEIQPEAIRDELRRSLYASV